MSHSTKGFLIVSVLIIVSSCRAENADAANAVTVRLYSDVQLSTQTLAQAEQEATRIFRKARIEIVWVQCKPSSSPTDPRCSFPPASKLLAIRIVPKALNAADSIFGMAFLSKEGYGAYGDVFYKSVETLHQQCNASVSRVLGHVMAHELGHLLLGSNAHTEIGIMRPHWLSEQLRAVERGTLLFSPEQARLMRNRLRTV